MFFYIPNLTPLICKSNSLFCKSNSPFCKPNSPFCKPQSNSPVCNTPESNFTVLHIKVLYKTHRIIAFLFLKWKVTKGYFLKMHLTVKFQTTTYRTYSLNNKRSNENQHEFIFCSNLWSHIHKKLFFPINSKNSRQIKYRYNRDLSKYCPLSKKIKFLQLYFI